MNKELEKILKEELRFENIRYSSFKNFKDTITEIYEKLKIKYEDKTEFSIKDKIKIKQEINLFLNKVYIDLENELSKEIEEQFKILEEKEKVSPILLLGLVFGGLTFSDMILKQKNYHLSILNTMVNSNKIEKKYFISNAINEQLRTIAGTISKKGREEIRNKVKNKQIIGWKSVAVLDGRTSSICLSKHNKFYSIEQYKNRNEIPDLPPRHYNCRSIIISIYNEEEKEEIGEDLNTFFKENEADALDILGVNRFKLFKEGKIDFKSFIDLRGGRLYTLEEIKERLL